MLAPHHAVDLKTLKAEFGVSVAAMVKGNLFAVRPHSSWAQDVPDLAFKATGAADSPSRRGAVSERQEF